MNYGNTPLNIPTETDMTPQNDRTIRAITEAGLPPLKGEPSELAEAAEVRLTKLIEADDLMTALRTDEQRTELGDDSAIPATRPTSAEDVRAAQASLNRLRHQDEAVWWLQHRNSDVSELMAMFTGQL